MPLPTSLVVKKGSKIFSFRSAGNAVAVVFDFDRDILARDQRFLFELRAIGGRDVAGAQFDPSAARHGVARIDDEIDDHMLELVEIGLDQPKIAAMAKIEHDLLADEAAHQHLQI